MCSLLRASPIILLYLKMHLPFYFFFLPFVFSFQLHRCFEPVTHLRKCSLPSGNEYRLTARALDSCVVRPTLIGFGDAQSADPTYRSSSFISFTWIIVAVTAAIAAYLQATSTRAPVCLPHKARHLSGNDATLWRMRLMNV